VEDFRSNDIGVVVEYHLPFSNQRIDAVFLGKSQVGKAQALIVELKQWSEVGVEDEFALNVLVEGQEHQHPSQQALDYAGALSDIHSSFVDGRLGATPCSFCHNLTEASARPLLSPQFTDLLKASPLFRKGTERGLAEHLDCQVGRGDGSEVLREYGSGRFKPSKKLIEVLEATINHNGEWHLLGRQREAYNAIFAQVRRLQHRKGHSAVLVRGGPGTGNSVIAVQLLADCIRLGFSAAHSTGGKAFTTALRSKFKGADRLFIGNKDVRTAATQSIDLLLVDEAHRVRETSDMRWTRASERGRRSQMEELLNCSKVTVFLLDENQYVRPDEIGCTDLIRTATKAFGVPLQEFHLDTQFRCGGCTEYTDWVDHLLKYRDIPPLPWGDMYRMKVVDSPVDLDRMMAEAKANGERARIVAGFCWEWSDPLPEGTLVRDVKISDWSRPWNAKQDPKKRYTPQNDPYTLWAETEAGEQEIGCIYSAQGFEFDRVGVIWGRDLVWRSGKWVAQKGESFDKPVKTKKADSLRLFRNAYRVLLTRGIKETWLLCLDPETRRHLREELDRMNPAGPELPAEKGGMQ
jgi:hypothetical protein